MEIKTDMFNIIPKIGDLVVFNPPKYKGLVSGTIKSFSKAGRPEVELLNSIMGYMYWEIKEKGTYSIKTNFAIVKNEL